MPDGNGDHEANTSLQGSQVAYFSLAGGRPMKPTDRLPWISSTEIPDGPKGRHPFKSALRLLSYMIPWKDQASCSATHHRAMQLAIVERLLAVEKSIDEAL